MPSTSAKQHRFMQAVAHNPEFAKKAGVPQKVGKHFSEADKGKQFKRGGNVEKESKEMADAEMKALKRGHAPKKVLEHERKEHKEMGYKKGGKVAPKAKIRRPMGSGAVMPPAVMAGPPGMAHGGGVHHHHYYMGGGIMTATKAGPEKIVRGPRHGSGPHGDEGAKRGHTKGKQVKMAKGGRARGDGIATKGYTRGKSC